LAEFQEDRAAKSGPMPMGGVRGEAPAFLVQTIALAGRVRGACMSRIGHLGRVRNGDGTR
jgi:hypothetical protein